MNYGLYLSAAGALASMHRQDVLANNLANVNTTAFKPDAVDLQQRLPERIERPVPYANPQWMLERLGGGTLARPTRVVNTQGDLLQSGNDLDVAVRGGAFLRVEGPAGENRLTRDGRLTRNVNGDLVMSTNGMRVLDDGGQAIRLDAEGDVHIHPSGEVVQNGVARGRIGLAQPAHPSMLRKAGENLFRVEGGAIQPSADGSQLVQGYTEGSAVDPVLTLTGMMAAAKAVQTNAQLMQYHDHIIGQTINTFARVS